MPNPFAKVKRGDPLRWPASLYNAIVDTVVRDLKNRSNTDGGAAPIDSDAGVIYIKNTSGGDRDRFEILGIDTPLILPTENIEAFKSDTPFNGAMPAAAHAGKFAVLLQPLAANAVGLAVVVGVTPVQLDVISADHNFADVKAADATKLETSSVGKAEILWKEAGTGTKWGVVRIGQKPAPLVSALKITGATANPSEYTAQLLEGDGGKVNSTSTNAASTLLQSGTVNFWNVEEMFYGSAASHSLQTTTGGSPSARLIGAGVYVGIIGGTPTYLGIAENYNSEDTLSGRRIGCGSWTSFDTNWGIFSGGAPGYEDWVKSKQVGVADQTGPISCGVPYVYATSGAAIELRTESYQLNVDAGGRIYGIQRETPYRAVLSFTNSAGLNLYLTNQTTGGEATLNIDLDLDAGVGIQISTSGPALEIKNTGVITLANAGGTTIADDGNGNFTVEAAIKSITAGSGCTVTDDGNGNITIDVP